MVMAIHCFFIYIYCRTWCRGNGFLLSSSEKLMVSEVSPYVKNLRPPARDASRYLCVVFVFVMVCYAYTF